MACKARSDDAPRGPLGRVVRRPMLLKQPIRLSPLGPGGQGRRARFALVCLCLLLFLGLGGAAVSFALAPPETPEPPVAPEPPAVVAPKPEPGKPAPISPSVLAAPEMPAPDSAEKDLRADKSVPKLETETPPPPAPPAPAANWEPTPPVPAEPPVPTPTAEPPVPVPALAPEPVVLSLEDIESIRALHREDTPMMLRWKKLGWQAMLAAALVAAPAVTPVVAADSDGKPNGNTKTIEEKLDLILKKLEDLDKLKADVEALKVKADLQKQATREILNKINDDIERMGADIGRMQREIDELRRQMNSGGRVSGASPVPNAAAGRIRLRNTFRDPVTIVVNGTAYDLDPGESVMLDNQPAGTFTYEVLGIQQPVRRLLEAGETFTINVYTR